MSGKTVAGTLTGMFLATLGVDFLCHAGLLAHYYVHPGPAVLPAQQLFRRIPFGYASILLTLGLELWLVHRIGVKGAKAGACFGTICGVVLGVAGALGLFSIVPLGPVYLTSVAVCQIVEYAIAGALAGSAIASGRVRKVIVIGLVVFFAGVAAGMIIQPGRAASM